MNLHLHFIEDAELDYGELSTAATANATRLGLSGMGIKLCCEPLSLIRPDALTAKENLSKCITAMQSLDDTNGHIVFLDLELIQWGLSVDDAICAHNLHTPAALHIYPTSSDDIKRKSAGYLLAWLALHSATDLGLLVYTSGAWSRQRIETKTAELRGAIAATAQRERIPHRIEDDSLGNAEAATKARYIENAINEWLGTYWCPMARLHPNGSERWFAAASPLHPVMSHNKPSTTGYAESVSRYLAKVLQISPALACDEYTKLSESAKNDLHEYLMCVVGAETACHNPCHRGRRIKWHHFPLLAALCCPPLGKWIFDDSCFPWRFQDSILPVAKSDCDAELLELLIGDREGKEDGVLCMLLRDKKDSSKSNLIEPLRVQNGECRIRVAFDITRLKSNFDDGVSKTQRPAHDCSGKLYELHTFLVQHGGAVIVTAGGEVVIQKPIR